MKQVRSTRQPMTTTKKGKRVAKLVPANEHEIFGCLAGEIEIVGDIRSPLVSPEEWEALR
jgi:antitoxin (DNA-binding transcriptional repressor) of toxin-antitoxin stability system